MVQTRRATQLAAAVIPPAEGMHTKRSSKRAKAGHQPDASAAQSATFVVDKAQENVHDEDAVPTKRPRKTRAIPKSPEFAPRVSSAWKVGAHVSAAGGVENTIVNAARVGANAFALFVKSQRKWASPPLKDEQVASFKARMDEFGYDPKYVLPHGSYLINLANPDTTKREKSYECLIDDLRRCERLGLVYYNFHPGSTVGSATKEESISLIAQCLNKAHSETSSVVTVIENMSGAKNIIGSQFAELRDIIQQVEDKSRVGVCLDTCHLYAAGYDIASQAGWNTTLAAFDELVGLSYLRGMHLNDSKTPLGSKKDRHENIGLGTLGLSAFLTILTDPRVQNIPLILETPSFEAMEIWEREISVLNKLSEIGAVSGVSMDGKGETKTEGVLRGMVDDVRHVVQIHGGHKMSGKSAPKSKAKPRKRKNTDEDDDGATSSEDAQPCGG